MGDIADCYADWDSDFDYEDYMEFPQIYGFGRRKDIIWTAKNGREIRVGDMKDNHVQNILAFLRRSLEQLGENYNLCNTKQDRRGVQSEIDTIDKAIEIFEAELKDRGLEPKEKQVQGIKTNKTFLGQSFEPVTEKATPWG